MFGAGRELGEEGTGSLTVIATVLDSDDRGAEVREALETTENLLLRLDADLAAKGIVPVARRRQTPAPPARSSCAIPRSWRRCAACARSSPRWSPSEAARALARADRARPPATPSCSRLAG